MRPLSYARATDMAGAIATVSADPASAFLAGGTTEIDLVRLGVTQPDLLVDINDLPLAGVEDRAPGGAPPGRALREDRRAPRARRDGPLPGRVPGAAAWSVGAVAQHGHDGREPVPTSALLLLPRRRVSVQQAR